MTYFINLKKLGVKSTVLASSIVLVACGGGGSDGYYNTDNSNTTNPPNSGGDNTSTTDTSQVATHLTRALQNASGQEIQLAPDNSKVYLAVKALNADNGGIANKNIRLSIATNKFGVSSANSVVATDENGVAVFEINVPALTEAEGSVQLTATVDGTSVSNPYTLNIKKSSTIRSDFRIDVTQGTVLILPNGSVDVTATVTDAKGGIKANQSVTLNMPEAMRGKFIITNGAATQQTNAQGEVKYTLKASSNFTSADLATFAGKSETLSFLLVDEDKAEKTATADLTFKDTAQIVSTLSVIKPDQAVAAKSTTPVKIKVLAKNDQHEPLSGKEIRLSFTKDELAYGVKLNNATAKTNAQGIAEFTISTADVTHPLALSDTGISLSATYTDGINLASGSVIVDVVTENTNASDADAIQRLEIASSYKVNAKNDSVAVTVKAINNKGLAATKGKIKLDLNAEATSNGVTLDGAAEKDLVNGFATFNIKTNAQTPAAVEALVKAGIKANFTTDNGVSNAIAITVANEEVSEEATHYLSIDPILTAFDYTKDQIITVKVKATGVNGSALKGETVSLGIAGSLSDKQLQDLGLSHTGQSSKQTEADGYATFTLAYKASLSPEQAALALANQGIPLVATSANGKTKTLRLNFKAPTEQGVIDLDHFTVDMLGDLTLTVGQEQTLTVNVTAKGTDGELLKNQLISIGLNDAALNNGVSYVSTQAIRTDVNGHAKFTIKVKAGNVTELTNLIANGLTVVVKSTRTDGSAFTVTKKVDVAQPPVVLPELAGLDIAYVGNIQTVSVLGGEVRVKVIAKDADGNAIPNTPIALALSSLTSSRVTLTDIPAQTNSKGEAEFTVTVAEGSYDPDLAKKGITFAVVGTNLNNGDRLQQTSTIQVTVPDEAFNLRLTSESKYIEFGETQKIQVAVKDELGLNTGGVPVQLSLPKAVTDLGVFLNNETVLVSKEGNVVVDLTIPANLSKADKDALLALGNIVVTGSITKPNGEKLKAELTFEVKNAINTNSLDISADKIALSVAGERTIVTVALKDVNGRPVIHQAVKLSALNTASLIIGTPGSGYPTNTSEPQTVLTDSNGNAFFSVETDGLTVDGDLLIASGIELVAEHVNEDGATASNIHRLDAYRPAPAPTEPLPAQYSLRIESSKPAMNVKNDMADVTVTLLDRNGGGVADKYVSLALNNFALNGAVIVGPSGITTNELGQATFRVKVDESARHPSYSAINFDTDELDLTARYAEEGYRDAQQISRILINNVADENPRASIVIGVNPTGIESSADGVYYTKNLSVKVSDFDGKPLANQAVEMSVIATTYTKGKYIWALAPVVGGTPEAMWVGPNEKYFENNDITKAPVENVAVSCVADASGGAVTNRDVMPNTTVPVKVVSFLGKGEDKVATYTTDKEGKFDLTIRYPKIYAQWLNVQIGASSTVASLPSRTTYNLGLASLTSDYSTDGTYGPNLNSPYGTSLNCN
ncbi:Ig-like domain-containing protein [Acinetobacter indicus]|uniref:Ig-like domain-containing protein n=1 Tax=Acinetobacter indicus TaxID=756892 RepID=UPI00209B6685|nr:Ig-like domain-containing protein [Acinetobacter indicus]MCO8089267.1 Ig-like domain-containing protein [Acinetobacter indicus]